MVKSWHELHGYVHVEDVFSSHYIQTTSAFEDRPESAVVSNDNILFTFKTMFIKFRKHHFVNSFIAIAGKN